MVKRYLITFILIIAIPIFLLLILFLRLFESLLIDNLSAQSLESTQQLAQDLNEEAQRTALLAAAIAHDENMLSAIYAYSRSMETSGSFQAVRQATEELTSLFRYTNQVGAVFFFFREKPLFYHRNVMLSVEENVKQRAWYQKVLQEPGKTHVLQDFSIHDRQMGSGVFLSCAIAPGKQALAQGLEMILVSFKSRILSDMLLEPREAKKGSLWVINAWHEVIFEQHQLDSDLLHGLEFPPHDGSQDVEHQQGKFLMVSARVPYARMTMVRMFEYKQLTTSIRQYSRYARLALGGLLVLFLSYSGAFFRSIIQPLRHVIQKMEQVGKGNMNVRVEAKGVSELNSLCETFNRMVGRIRDLTLQIEQKERQRAQAEIDALQFQINPHFLSNTLNAIKMMAAMVRAGNIQKMTGALMTIVSANFRNTGDLATLHQQVVNLESYIYIMKVRFGESFEVIYDIPDNLKETYLLKMLVQPVVENSILHGIRECGRKGRIGIRGWQEGERLYLEVSDNGVGIPPVVMAALWEKDDHPHKGLNCIGIRNVHERIHLNYGDEFGLKISTIVGEETRVTFILPLLTEREVLETHHV